LSENLADVVVLEQRIEAAVLRRLVERFEDMVKFVVDVERGVIAIGGEMHSDAEEVLLESGSRQADLGRQLLSGRARGCIESPRSSTSAERGNRGMEPRTRRSAQGS
jgi:hypothetical protein